MLWLHICVEFQIYVSLGHCIASIFKPLGNKLVKGLTGALLYYIIILPMERGGLFINIPMRRA